MGKIFLAAAVLAAFSFPAFAEITTDTYTIEVIRQVTFGEYFMIAFLSITITMYLFYLLDVHILKNASHLGEEVQQPQPGKRP